MMAVDPIAIREAKPADAASVAGLRVALLQELGEFAHEATAPYLDQWTSLFETWLADGTCRFWLAYDGASLVGGAGITLRAIFPNPARRLPLEARLQNFFVVPLYRGSQLGERLLRFVLAWISAAGITRVIVHPSVRTRPWYMRFGFEPLTDEFVLRADLEAAGIDPP